MPVVEVGGGYGWYDPATNIPCFVTDNKAIARLAVEHLLNHGFRRLAYCGFPRTRHNRWSEERAVAFKRLGPRGGLPLQRLYGAATRPRENGRNCSAA